MVRIRPEGQVFISMNYYSNRNIPPCTYHAESEIFPAAKVKSQYISKDLKFIKHESPCRNHPVRIQVFIRIFLFQ